MKEKRGCWAGAQGADWRLRLAPPGSQRRAEEEEELKKEPGGE